MIASGVLVGGGADAAPKDKVPMQVWATGAPVQGSFAQLDRSANGITAKVRTDQTARHAYTVWFAVFNDPANCSPDPLGEPSIPSCGEDDVFDQDQRDAALISVVYAGGAVANAAGRIQIDGSQVIGQVGGPGQVVVGRADDGAFLESPVTGVTNPMGAEVHLVLQDHGMAHAGHELREQQITQFLGACNTSCEDLQFAIFMP
ncbi:MAG: hypothetical protein ACR2H3_11205 [Acidimicrobiales bacterium]